ncbi:MAG: hypothetical protein V4726_00895 [Verrucomicrobiota bacterium]
MIRGGTPKGKNRKALIAALAATVSLGGTAHAKAERAMEAPARQAAPLVHLREYQIPVFQDKETKMLILEWSRQIGKSHVLAHWACDRLMQQLARPEISAWTIIVISNSKGNGAEFGVKVSEALGAYARAADEITQASGALPEELKEFGLEVEDCQYRLGVTLKVMENGVEVTKTGRILILAASPRTARGFSADLILDEWAFHENAAKMWAAAEPIISSNPEFLCRVASTHNGPNSLFNRWIRRGEFPVSSMTRSGAWAISHNDPVAPLTITSLKTKRPLTPEEAQEEAGDKREYLQNYENQPSAESGSLLTWDLIHSACRAPSFARDEQVWSPATLQRLYRLTDGDFYVGQDVGRNRDASVVAVIQKVANMRRLVALLRMRDMRLDFQRRQMQNLMSVVGHRIRRIAMDFTGLGTGLTDELRGLYGDLVIPVHFASTVPVTPDVAASGRKSPTMAVTELMAINLARLFDDKLIEIPTDKDLEESLHLPERVVSANGQRVSIAAEKTQDEEGFTEHADHFWALALAEHGVQDGPRGAFDAESAAGVVMGGGGMGRTPWISTFDPAAREGPYNI